MKMNKCLMFVAVMFFATLFGVYDSDNIANAAHTKKRPKTAFITCGLPFQDHRDGQWYATVQIGNECWMAQNLNVGTRIDGLNDQTDDGIIEKYCYEDEEANCFAEGGLYQWDEMMRYRTREGVKGICPKGWHIPADHEWKNLEMALGMSQTDADDTGFRGTDQGDQLKTAADCDGGVNCGTSGFHALLAGFRSSGGSFGNRGTLAFFWSSTEGGSVAWGRTLGSGEARVSRDALGKAGGFSVRCVKD